MEKYRKKLKDDIYLKLITEAIKVRNNAYAPYSEFKVGAALLSDSGKIYVGVNVENSSFGATICAEQSAITRAISEGERNFLAICIVSDKMKTWPCGICRQVLSEFGNAIEVVTYRSDDEDIESNLDKITVEPLSELLKNGFKL